MSRQRKPSGLRGEASDPGGIRLSKRKLQVLRPDLCGLRGWWRERLVSWGFDWSRIERIGGHLQNGDSRAAIVMSTQPMLVAAFTDELDCVAMVKFPDSFASDYGLEVGARLLTVNTYCQGEEIERDLMPGERDFKRYVNFVPIIADFLTDDAERLDERKREIEEEEWQRAESMGRSYREKFPNAFRDCRPMFTHIAAEVGN